MAKYSALLGNASNGIGELSICLVNNAGYGQLGMFETIEADAIAKQYQTNVFGTFNVVRAVLPTMRKQRSGHILNISSIGGVVGFGGATAYTSSKFAIEGFSEDLAIEVRPFGIHVTIVEPGFFRTDFLDGSSVKYGTIEIADYAEAVAKQRAQYDAHNHKQPGDPSKLGPAIVKIVQSGHPPLRYDAGSDAVRMTEEALEKRVAELAEWKELSVSTDLDDAQATASGKATS
jgi:NAD(P)-dependent dehydrogenase (short-subunit alcohol dehydrogenase family)